MTVPLLSVALVGWLVLAAVMVVLWAIQKRTGDAAIVDVGWTAGVGAIGVAAAILGEGDVVRRTLLGGMIGAWSLRLSLHLIVDRVRASREDGRYAALRERLGDRAQAWFFGFFQAQAALAALLATPFLIVASYDAPTSLAEVAAVALWLVALVGELVADRQLAAFRAEPTNRGRTCRRGLWRYSRHPNYFFEWLHWLAYPLLAVGSPHALLTLLSPALLLVLILKVTGIPPTEEQALRSRGDDYRAYQRTTSAFFPWIPQELRT